MPSFEQIFTSVTGWVITILIAIIAYLIKLGITSLINYGKEIRKLLNELVLEITKLNSKNELQDSIIKNLETQCSECRKDVGLRLHRHGMQIDDLNQFKSKVEGKLDI